MIGGAGAMMAAEGSINLWPLQAAPAPSGRNVIIFLTDQERALQWFPPGWAAANLPCQTALANTGVTFSHAYTNTAMCTPARTTLFTGLYPAQHLSTNTLSEGNVQSESEHQLNPTYPNLGTVMTSAGYEMVYIGKYHLSKGIIQPNSVNIWDDIERYSFTQWDPPDAGRNTALGDYGGGNADNDARYISDALDYLTDKINNPGGKPFCLVISLVNPHDVLGYPNNYINGGYTNNFGGVSDWIAPTTPPIGLPPTVNENLATNFKPTCQVEYLAKCAGLGVLPTAQLQINYLNFYGNVMKYVDSQFQQVMDLLNTAPTLLNNTWIVRTSDHGEYGMVHEGLRQKSFSVYDEAIRVPLIWSNPVDYPAGHGQQCDQLVGHVDFLPTLCSMLGINPKQYRFSGTDYSSLIKNPAGPAVQDYILFTYDDIWCGQNAAGNPNGIVGAPNRIRAVRQLDYVYAYYFDGQGVAQPQTEFYDLRTFANHGTDTDMNHVLAPILPDGYVPTGNPVEYTNLSAWAEGLRTLRGNPTLITPSLLATRTQMQKQLQQAVATKLQPLPIQPAVPPQNFSIGEVNWTDDYGQLQSALQITWLSRSSTQYELQLSTDHITWTSVGDPLPGNNGPIILTQPVTGLNVSYRLAWRPNPDNERIPEPQIR
jgi:arylsulfatase A-like enzyme